MSTIDKLNSDASMLDIKNTLQQINEYQASTNNRLYTVLQNQNIESTADMTLNELISATDEGFSNIISNKNTKIDELETQVTDLNSQLEGKVTPAGTAVASNVLSGKTFINSTGNTVTGTMTNQGSKTVTPKSSSQTLSAGYYNGITINGDSNLKAANIKSGVSIFGVSGSYTATSSASFTTESVNKSLTCEFEGQESTTIYVSMGSSTPSILILEGEISFYDSYNDGTNYEVCAFVMVGVNGSLLTDASFVHPAYNEFYGYVGMSYTSSSISLYIDTYADDYYEDTVTVKINKVYYN